MDLAVVFELSEACASSERLHLYSHNRCSKAKILLKMILLYILLETRLAFL